MERILINQIEVFVLVDIGSISLIRRDSNRLCEERLGARERVLLLARVLMPLPVVRYERQQLVLRRAIEAQSLFTISGPEYTCIAFQRCPSPSLFAFRTNTAWYLATYRKAQFRKAEIRRTLLPRSKEALGTYARGKMPVVNCSIAHPLTAESGGSQVKVALLWMRELYVPSCVHVMCA